MKLTILTPLLFLPSILAITVTPYPKHPKKPRYTSTPRTSKICTVPSGETDSAASILAAAHSCNNGGTIVFSPNKTYTIGTALDLTFLSHVDLDIQGTILFSNDTDYWNANAFYLTFQNATTFWQIGGEDVNIYGGGTLNGNGQVWYDKYAKDIYILRPILLGIVGLTGGSVSNINMRFSPQWFNIIVNSTDVVYDHISISGGTNNANPAKNTDGWDTYRSSAITIQNSVINNGDDCVSFKPNSTDIVVQGLDCTGSHGISVGSLGQYPGEYDIVEDIYVYNISMTSASDGARIKVWPGTQSALSGDLQGGGGRGHVKNVTYDTFGNHKNDYAIQVTQCYGQKNKTLCELYPSELTISDIYFKNFYGTTSSKYDPTAGTVVCSSPTVCSKIYAENITVTPPSGKAAVYTCSNVNVTQLGLPCA
ncbi:uncharacterized protein LAJ45_09362 [Morchella importuna]|uniref:uncharacterized protein n=1 Tax=Morchella importuna TaxID=1174673 RepID=UPI001E8D9229|nr:uncharacterized protein LAJ45_09362 [Morchella importuna]KAH8146679.1 hypothetical protein LAJ45_09362 [Morchella importuna]